MRQFKLNIINKGLNDESGWPAPEFSTSLNESFFQYSQVKNHLGSRANWDNRGARMVEYTPEISGPSKLISVPILGGLHHRYVRVAA